MIILEIKIHSLLPHPQFNLHLYLHLCSQRLPHQRLHLPNQVYKLHNFLLATNWTFTYLLIYYNIDFRPCINNWCYQHGTKEQYTRCKRVSNNGRTCHNPEIRYGTTVGGKPGGWMMQDTGTAQDSVLFSFWNLTILSEFGIQRAFLLWLMRKARIWSYFVKYLAPPRALFGTYYYSPCSTSSSSATL